MNASQKVHAERMYDVMYGAHNQLLTFLMANTGALDAMEKLAEPGSDFAAAAPHVTAFTGWQSSVLQPKVDAMRKSPNLSPTHQRLFNDLDELNTDLLDLADAWRAVADKQRPSGTPAADVRSAAKGVHEQGTTAYQNLEGEDDAFRCRSRGQGRVHEGRPGVASTEGDGHEAGEEVGPRRGSAGTLPRGAVATPWAAVGLPAGGEGIDPTEAGRRLERAPRSLALGQAVGDDVERGGVEPEPDVAAAAPRRSRGCRHGRRGTPATARHRRCGCRSTSTARAAPRGGGRPPRRTPGRTVTPADRRASTPRCGHRGPSAAASPG